MDNKQEKSVFFQNIQRGIDKRIIFVSDDSSKIMYYCKRNYSTSFKNPEEKVRASYFCELVLDYDYLTKKIDIEVPVPRRTPEDRADMVVYDEKGVEYLVVSRAREIKMLLLIFQKDMDKHQNISLSREIKTRT
ncbi:MAG: type I restriction enzyme HsdR N-terminal domain-containing protein [Candidatus Stahlbacteria bacterium]|nr:type I restriction enzyme HsdR N-terminal domain-containing protein [Candidatus Stahlbacteria bacterium]